MAGRPNKAWLNTMINELGSRKAVSERMAEIGSLGGQKSRGGGFAANITCHCDYSKAAHHNAQCAGYRGGLTSRRRAKTASDR